MFDSLPVRMLAIVSYGPIETPRRYRNEYDCQNKMYRISQVTSYAGPMLSGKKLFDINEEGYWRKIPPNGLFVLGYVAHCVQ